MLFTDPVSDLTDCSPCRTLKPDVFVVCVFGYRKARFHTSECPECACELSCARLGHPMDCKPAEASLSVDFSRQEYWSGLPFPSPGDLPDRGIEPTSLSSPALADGFFTS